MLSYGDQTFDTEDAWPRPRRAKDFVKCTDPNCLVLIEWAEANMSRLSLGMPVRGTNHCHPIF